MDPWKKREPVSKSSESTSDFWKRRQIEHYRAHGKSNVVLESELEKMKAWGLYREGDELLTVDFYLGDFIVLRNGDAVRVKYGQGSKDIEFEEEKWMMKARGGK